MRTTTIIGLPLWLLLSACSSLQTDGEFMYLRNAGADLPVWVRGNTDSKVAIVWLSSGPGDPVSVMRGAATDALERRYAMVYWDQRGCGSAQGNPAPDTFTMDQFVEDTDKVIELVRARTHAERIFLLGHSWGGTLGTAYLLDPQRRAKIAGFIDLDGNHDVPLLYPMKLAWLKEYAAQRIADGSNVRHWTEVRDFCASQPPLSRANLARWEDYVDGTNAAFHDPDYDFNVDFDLIFRSPDSAFAYLLVNRSYVEDSLYRDDAVLSEMSYSSRMHEIDTPAALLWGRHDGIVPLPAAHAAYDSLGTPESEKRLRVFEHSAHFPFLEEPDAFVEEVSAFVEEYR
jgi:proline iminopeptidase